jgi:hypothetical protein
MTTRRQILHGLPAIWLASTAPVNASPRKSNVDEMVADLTAKLAEMHGGEWSCRQTPNFYLFQREL